MNYPRFDKEHIEELIFDYHEGNLSESEKAELLNLIHQHPELERDFALWAQSYAHVEGKVPDYGLTDSLIQKPVVTWYAQTWFKTILVSSVMLLIGVAFFGSNKEIKEEKKENIVNQKENIQHKNYILDKSDQSLKIVPKNIYQNEVSKTFEQNVEQSKRSHVEESNEVATETEIPTEIQTPENVELLEKNATLKPDSLPVVVTKEKVEEKPKNENLTKKSKGKRFNLKPSSEFIPVNADF